jgi:energy-coupling factor transport system substrate-specific component
LGKRRWSARELALFGLFGGLIFAAKMAMAQLPNIEPVSLLVMLLAVSYGWRAYASVLIYILLEFSVWGLGLWSAAYLYVWLILFAAARLLRSMDSPLGWAVLSGGFGLLFGALCALVYWVVGGWAAAVSWWVAGIPADLLHGAGNFTLALVLFRPLRRRLSALNRQFGFPDHT